MSAAEKLDQQSARETEKLEIIEFSPGDVLFHEGDASYYFYMIQEGEVEVYRITGDEEVILATIDAGQPLGEFAMIDKKPRSASARAKTAVTAVRISEQGYKSMLEELPQWAHSMMVGLVDRLRQANSIIESQKECLDDRTEALYEASEFEMTQKIELDLDFSSLGGPLKAAPEE